MPNNSLERTQPQRGFMYHIAVLRRSARVRWAHNWATLLTGCKGQGQHPSRKERV